MKWFQRGFLVLLIAGSLYASVVNLISTRDLGSLSDDPVADFARRFDPLKARLPFKTGVIGYIADSDIPGISYDAANLEGEYTLTQYVMSPIVLVKGLNQEWTIALLSPQAFDAWNQAHSGKFEVIPFKGNLYLLHRLSQ